MTTGTILAPLEAYLPGAYPDRAAATVSNLLSINAGWESDVYAFDMQWGLEEARQRDELILRIYPGADAYDKSFREFRALTIVRQAGYPVPRVDLLERDASPFGRPFLIMERVPGRGMWDEMFHTSPERQEQMRVLFCGLFARLHALDWHPYVPDPENFDPEQPYALVERQMERWQGHMAHMPIPGFQAAFNWMMDHQHDATSDRAVPVHWDFHPANILLKENDEAVVIDWTNLDLSDYRFDLSWTLLLLGSHVDWSLREPFLREYERQAGKQVEDFAFFDAAACVRRLFSVVGSLLMGADKMGMRPGAEEMMRSHAPAMRRVYEHFFALTSVPIPEVEAFLVESGV